MAAPYNRSAFGLRSAKASSVGLAGSSENSHGHGTTSPSRACVLAIALSLALASLLVGRINHSPSTGTPKRDFQSLSPAFALAESAPNVVVRYYDVQGTDIVTIRHSLDEHRPVDPNDHASTDAMSVWNLRWHWPVDAHGSCDLERASVDFSGQITLPRLTTNLSENSELQARWTSYLSALKNHEAVHIIYPLQHLNDVQRAIRSSTCATANESAKAAFDILRHHDLSYDLATEHGVKQGAIFP